MTKNKMSVSQNLGFFHVTHEDLEKLLRLPPGSTIVGVEEDPEIIRVIRVVVSHHELYVVDPGEEIPQVFPSTGFTWFPDRANSWRWKRQNKLLRSVLDNLDSATAVHLSRACIEETFGFGFLMDIVTGKKKVDGIGETRRLEIAKAMVEWVKEKDENV